LNFLGPLSFDWVIEGGQVRRLVVTAVAIAMLSGG